MTNYEKMVAEARKTRTARISAMVRGGKTPEEAKAVLKAEADRRFAAASARAKCGITKRATTRLADKWPKY